ncbi:hypothetical protein CPB85DRAFT_877446 [Mucidula mucida]|nr:hypothetical protein CPB85DRAFT_877446 [Mucidula mucida]
MIKVQALLLRLSKSPHSLHTPLPNENDICLPHLRRLTLTFGGLRPREPGQLIGFLDRIRAPLSRLDMTFDSVMFVPELNATTISYLMTLEVMGDMGRHESNTRSLLQFLTYVPTVTTLKVVDKSITTAFVMGLTVVSIIEPVLPLLHSLDISGCQNHQDMMPMDYFWDRGGPVHRAWRLLARC